MLCEKKMEMSKRHLSKMKANFKLEVRKLGRNEKENVCIIRGEKNELNSMSWSFCTNGKH